MTQIAQFVRLAPAPDHYDALLEALETAMAAAVDEPGTLAYAFHTASELDVIWLYELYRDGDAHREHGASAATARLREVFATALASPPEVQRGTLVDSFGMASADSGSY